MQLKEMEKATASREQVFAVLRKKDIQHLGQVKRLYLEAGGMFSLFIKEDPVPGLSVLPKQDEDLMSNQSHSGSHYACSNCGNTEEDEVKQDHECPRCGANNWSQAFDMIPANQNNYTLKEASE